MEFLLKSEKDTHKLGHDIANIASVGDIFCLKGELGIGKTTLARSIIKHLTKVDNVPSPTYPLMINYQYNNSFIWHFDLYRLESPQDIWNIGLEDALNNGIILIEWPEIIEKILPEKKVVISFIEEKYNNRKATIYADDIFLNKFNV